MKYAYLLIVVFILSVSTACSNTANANYDFSELKNYQINTPTMLSSGLPTEQDFIALKSMGVTKVIDLIPGDRKGEVDLLAKLNLEYHNIPVDWNNPKLTDFQQYVEKMQSSSNSRGKTLTHCRLNWRGAVFTYLYRVTQLGETKEAAEQDMLAIWQPNDTWQSFIDEVMNHYSF